MRDVALKMLLGDRAKYIGLIFGVTFATLLMAQQVSIFTGIMSRTANAITSVREAEIWVMDPRVRYVDEVEPMRPVELSNVRSVAGVEWAVPHYKGLATVRLPDGMTQQVQLIGVDDVSLVGLCTDMIAGQRDVVRDPQSAVIDRNGFLFVWPQGDFATAKPLELNDNRLTVRGVCNTQPTFLTFPILYVTYDAAMEMTPPQRNKLPFILVKGRAGQSPEALAKRITQQTGLQALTTSQFQWRSINYYLERTGIPINFGITIALGAIIGAAITAQTFYIFVVENLKQFAAMKAVGVTNGQLLQIVLTQAGLVGVIGYGLGIGFTALFFFVTKDAPALQGFRLYGEIMAGTAIAIAVIILASILFSLGKVFRLDPAVVFRG
ncbi:FtsX-like permease family protein [Asticcacaulis sp. AC402]|uniref:ABC transporter permease n=1 Tax=Asticcacaulis sp. AC402 TaxID=1282361 RepID=UPI0003C40BA7|nr:ABC transporter permease [Asticcacaulis sp. AC402]ESQ74002.1 ABC transporter permease [Asticcacaulis sp. AC402]